VVIPPVPPLGAAGAVTRPAAAPAAGFGDALKAGLQEVSNLEHSADALSQSLASGGPTQIQDVMIATTKASLGVDVLTQVRNRAVEAYQEIMRMQV
jgi:flagellar hook-basal body complex protein FliE